MGKPKNNKKSFPQGFFHLERQKEIENIILFLKYPDIS
jgi:hypothetical protein